MPTLFSDFLFELGIILPTMLLIGGTAWLILARLGQLKLDQPWSAAKLRTWKLPYVLAEAAIFSVAFAAAISIAGSDGLGTALAGGIASIAMLLLGPLLPAAVRQ